MKPSELPPQRAAFILNVAAGESVTGSARELGIPRRTAFAFLKRAEVQAEINRHRREWRAQMEEKLDAAAPLCIDALMHIVRTSADAKEVIPAARTVLEHAHQRKFQVETIVQQAEPSRISEDTIQNTFARLEAAGGLTDPKHAAAWQHYKAELEAAEKDERWDTVPADFEPWVVDESSRLRDWRRQRFPTLPRAEFELLLILKSLLARSRVGEQW